MEKQINFTSIINICKFMIMTMIKHKYIQMVEMTALMICITCCQSRSALVRENLSNSEIIAEMKLIGNHLVTVCDINLLKDTIVLPLSYFTEELQIVKLDFETSFVYESNVTVGNHHILVAGSNRMGPFKLFNKSGKFIANIGGVGNGPNEFNSSIVESQLDENNNRIYLLPSNSDKILVYDLLGNVYDPIRLPFRTIFDKFHVNTLDSIVTIFAPPIANENYFKPYCVWVQNEQGEILHGVKSDFFNFKNVKGHFIIRALKSNNTKDLSIFYFASSFETPTNEMLYHYDVNNNKLIPKFGINFRNRKIYPHTFFELPNHYMCKVFDSESVPPVTLIVEKSSLKGSYFKLINDYLGNADLKTFTMMDGYYTANYEPLHLLEIIENALISKKNTIEMRNKLTKLRNTINEDDNNYILYAKLKNEIH